MKLIKDMQHRLLFFGEEDGRRGLPISDTNAEVSDTTGDNQGTEAGYIIFLSNNLRLLTIFHITP
jgi:hypothetical protein